MTIEWIRFWIVAVLTLLGILTLAIAIFGTFRFQFALNRIHSAAIADTLALILFVAALALHEGAAPISLKLLLVVGFQWCTSPVSSHLLTKFEYMTDKTLARYCILPDNEKSRKDAAK
ncbi:MAG: monovalent cation/H(+) antiporter subunit G [Clostridiales bacterium]|jgi:multicomponent Na+:H+ antiporter subunit G|nr:monovalent cation/H(+) antiporter subunit G [Clostridiales bacterium]